MTENIYLHMLTEYVISQLKVLQPLIIFQQQQDGDPPHWNLNVRNYLDRVFLENGSVRVVQFHGYLVPLTRFCVEFCKGRRLQIQCK